MVCFRIVVVLTLVALRLHTAACRQSVASSRVLEMLQVVSELFLQYECTYLGTESSENCGAFGSSVGALSPYDVVRQVPYVDEHQDAQRLLEEVVDGGAMRAIFHERDVVMSSMTQSVNASLLKSTSSTSPRLTSSQMTRIIDSQLVEIDGCKVYMPAPWNENAGLTENLSYHDVANQYYVAQEGNVLMLPAASTSSNIKDLALSTTSWYKQLLYPSKKVVFVLDPALYLVSVCAAMSIAVAQIEALMKLWLSPADYFQLVLASETPYLFPSTSGKSLISASQENLNLVLEWTMYNMFTNVSYSNLTFAVDAAFNFLSDVQLSSEHPGFIVMLSSVDGFAGRRTKRRTMHALTAFAVVTLAQVQDSDSVPGTIVQFALTRDENERSFGKCSARSSILPNNFSTSLKVLTRSDLLDSDIIMQHDVAQVMAMSTYGLIKRLETAPFNVDRRVWSLNVSRSSANAWIQSKNRSFIAALAWSCYPSPSAIGVVRADFTDEALVALLWQNSLYGIKSFQMVPSALTASLDRLTMQDSFAILWNVFEEAKLDQLRVCCRYLPTAMQQNSSCVEYAVEGLGSGTAIKTKMKLLYCWKNISDTPYTLIGQFQLRSMRVSASSAMSEALVIPALSFLPHCQGENRSQGCWGSTYSDIVACYYRLDLLHPVIPARFSYPWGGSSACGREWCSYDTSVWSAAPSAVTGWSLFARNVSLASLLLLNEQIK
eukprot:752267-Hanusia_phi.AAC.5